MFLACFDSYSGIVSLTIITPNILKTVFDDVEFINKYETWMGIFAFVSTIFSFKDISSMKCVSYFISVIRFTVIFLFLTVPIYIMMSDKKVHTLGNFS